MKTKDRMVKDVYVCRMENNLAEVAAIMWEEQCGALPVIDAAGRVISLITDRDICIALGTRNLPASQVQVKDVALPRVFTCREADDIFSAMRTMVAQNVRRLPVVDHDDKLVGIVSIDDMLLHTEPGRAGVLSLEVLDAMKHIIENRLPGHIHERAEVATTH